MKAGDAHGAIRPIHSPKLQFYSKMSRILCSIALLFLAFPAMPQDLANRIPANAVGVLKVNTPRFFENVSAADFSESALGAALVRFLDENGEGQANIADYGIALDRAAYLYATRTDSVRYTVFLWPVADTQKLEATLFNGKEVTAAQGYRQYLDAPSNGYGTPTLYSWDNNMLTVISTEQTPGYFDDEAVAERLGIENKGYYDFYEEHQGIEAIEGQPYDSADYWDEADTVDFDIWPPEIESAEIESAEELATMAISVEEADEESEWATVDSLREDAWADADTLWKDTWTDTDTLWEDAWTVAEAQPYLHEDEGYTDWYQLYEAYTQRDQQIKDSVMAVWATDYARSLLASPAASSILQNPGYAEALDNKAIVSAWIPDFNTLYAFAWPEIFNLGLGTTGKALEYYGAMRVDVYADKDLRITSTMDVAENMARPIKRMYDSKVNRKFFRYIDSENMLGMYGFATNTKAILEELPAFLANTYGSIAGPYQEEIALVAETTSLLLDEEAISRVVKGDGIFILNGLEEQEVPFTHYGWDDDYNWIEVDSVKNELVPDFLFMLSSDDRGLYDRLTDYLVRKGEVQAYGRLVEIRQPNMPFGIYLAHHNGILFAGSSAEKLESILANRYRGKLQRNHRRMLRRHVATGVFNVSNAAKEFDNEQLNTLDRYIAVRKIFGDLGNMEYTLRMRGNRMEHEFVSRTPREYPNAIYQLMSLVEYASGSMD